MSSTPTYSRPARPPYTLADGRTIDPEWIARFAFTAVSKDGKHKHKYVPSPKQLDFHESEILNCIMEGRRGTGKSWAIRNDGHMRALAFPGFTYLVVRRTMGELKKTHLKFLDKEMKCFDGTFNKTDSIANYPNGSMGFYASCNSEDEMLKLLGGDYHAIYFDEITTFTGEQIGKIGTCLRVPEDPDGTSIVILPRLRGGTNPIGIGAEYVHAHFILKDVNYEEEPDYNPADYEAIHLDAADNLYIDPEKYDKQFAGVPLHIRRAWKNGEWIVEGAYFQDYMAMLDDKPWHVIHELPMVPVPSDGTEPRMLPMTACTWLLTYRAQDWGFSPDPAVTLWLMMLPNGRAIVFKERDWLMTPASKVASDLEDSSVGMRVAETYADPTMFRDQQATELHSIADIFADNGIPLTKSRNDRTGIGFAIHEWLNTILDDGLPKLQFYAPGCPKLVKTLPMMRVDPNNPTRIADSRNDHWTIALGYFCQGRIGTSDAQQTGETTLPWWMRGSEIKNFVLGRESVRR
jgi:hypothetical protein